VFESIGRVTAGWGVQLITNTAAVPDNNWSLSGFINRGDQGSLIISKLSVSSSASPGDRLATLFFSTEDLHTNISDLTLASGFVISAANTPTYSPPQEELQYVATWGANPVISSSYTTLNNLTLQGGTSQIKLGATATPSTIPDAAANNAGLGRELIAPNGQVQYGLGITIYLGSTGHIITPLRPARLDFLSLSIDCTNSVSPTWVP
jgi:hypothetical protein